MDSTESVSDDIMVDIINWNSEDIILGISYYATLGLYDNTILGVADYSKLRGLLGCKEGESLEVSQWGVEGIPRGKILGTNVNNDE